MDLNEDVKALIQEYESLFPDVPSRTDRIAHDVEINHAPPIKQHPYCLNPTKQKHLEAEIEYLLKNDFIEPSQSNWSSPCLLVPKPDGSYRMCTDYRKLNKVTKAGTYPILRIDDCVGNAKYVSKFNLLKGFWHIPLTDCAKEVSAFVTPKGLYQHKVTQQREVNDKFNKERVWMWSCHLLGTCGRARSSKACQSKGGSHLYVPSTDVEKTCNVFSQYGRILPKILPKFLGALRSL